MWIQWADNLQCFSCRKRCKLVREFFNDVYKTNSGRAIHKQHPLEYEQGSVVCHSFVVIALSLLSILLNVGFDPLEDDIPFRTYQHWAIFHYSVTTDSPFNFTELTFILVLTGTHCRISITSSERKLQRRSGKCCSGIKFRIRFGCMLKKIFFFF